MNITRRGSLPSCKGPEENFTIVTSGVGRSRRWEDPAEEIRPVDVVWFPPGEKHRHGASSKTAMSHIALQEGLDAADWLEKVSDEQYEG